MKIAIKNENEKMDDGISTNLNVTANTTLNEMNIGGKENRKSKGNKRKKIRRLADPNANINNKSASTCKRILIYTGLITFTVALLVGHYFTQNNTNTQHIIKEFLKNYRNQYTQIVHGKQNYCDQNQPLDTNYLFDRIKQYRILHQEKALQEIKMALRNDSDFNSITLVGPVGVGKTLFMRALVENFPWQENVQLHLWNSLFNDKKIVRHLIEIMIDGLSECGQNLLVIDNLTPADHEIVTIINNSIRKSIAEQRKRVTVFYIFSLNTMLPPEKYQDEKLMVLSLPESNVIQFSSFSKAHVEKCIQREMELESLTINQEDIDEIVATIDPRKSGCKNVYAKVLMYGQTRT